MTTQTDSETNACTFQWKIENFSHCWLQKKNELLSPAFIADAVEGTKWTLWLYPMGCTDENYVSVYIQREKDCSGPDIIKVNWQLSFLGKDGSIAMERCFSKCNFEKKVISGYAKFVTRERVFVTERETFLPEDTLTVQCKIWNQDSALCKSIHLFATTVISVKRRYVFWNIDKNNTLKSRLRNIFRDYLFSFDLLLNESFDRLDITMSSFDDSIKYISYKTSIIDSEGKKEVCEIKKYFPGDLEEGILSSVLLFPKMVTENKSHYMPNDVLTLDIEFVFATADHFLHTNKLQLVKKVIGKEKSLKTTVLGDDLKFIHNDGISSDMEIRTSTKTFPVHKNILSAKSAVFMNKFSQDIETNCGHVDITNFEDDTIHRMLLFMYTDSLEDLQFESATKLYRIADEYQIPSLKGRCSSFLIENLSPSNACSVLDMALQHNDDGLQRQAQGYIFGQRNRIFCSQEWKDFMKKHLELAADLMYFRIVEGVEWDM